MSLHDKKYIVIRKILSEEVTKIYYDYLVNKEKGCITLIENKMINLDENISEEVIGFASMLPMGEYKLKDQVTGDDEEIDAQPGDIVNALQDTPPSDTILGVDVFPVIHKRSNKIIYVSLEDIK